MPTLGRVIKHERVIGNIYGRGCGIAKRQGCELKRDSLSISELNKLFTRTSKENLIKYNQ